MLVLCVSANRRPRYLPQLWRDYARYLCRSWNARHEGAQQLESLEVVLMTRHTPPEGQAGAYHPTTLLRYECGFHE